MTESGPITIRRRNGGTTLYRYFDAERTLLYVGIAANADTRQVQHASYTRWWREVASARFEHYDSRSDALDAETRAIQSERPKYNRDKLVKRRIGIRAGQFSLRRLVPAHDYDEDGLSQATKSVELLFRTLRDEGWPEIA